MSSRESTHLRYDWDRIIGRAQFCVPAGKAERKSFPSASTIVAVARTLSFFGNLDGREIRPGVELLADEAGVSVAAARRVVALLKECGLLVELSRGSRHGRKGWSSVYRLAIPENLLELVHLVVIRAPGERRAAVAPVRGEQRSHASGGSPVDNPAAEADNRPPASGDPGDHSPHAGCGYSEQRPPAEGTPPASEHPPAHDQPITPTSHRESVADVRTDGNHFGRARPSNCQDHGLAGGVRDDGKPRCPICRRIAATPERPPAGDTPPVRHLTVAGVA